MRIVLTGGGTLGSVTPLIAVWQELIKRQNNVDCLFIGTKTGPEKKLINYYGLKYLAIPSGKLRRYFSLKNLFDPLFILAGLIKSFFILKRFKPQVIISAGGFVAVPVIYAAKLLKIKVIIHQLDFQPTLSNQLCQKLAAKITVTFNKSLTDYPANKTVLVGSLIRNDFKNLNPASSIQHPITILVIGGGTGATFLNQLANDLAKNLPDIQIINLTGNNKQVSSVLPNYQSREFVIEEMPELINRASIVITRAGIAFLTELSYLSKPTIIIPIPNSHQEINAQYFANKFACLYLKQNEINVQLLSKEIYQLINNQDKLKELGENMRLAIKQGGELTMADIIIQR